MILLPFVLIAIGLTVATSAAYNIGRRDERRNAEMREHLARVSGGRDA